MCYILFVNNIEHKEGIYMKLTESETVELKRSTSELKEAIISLGAMLEESSRV